MTNKRWRLRIDVSNTDFYMPPLAWIPEPRPATKLVRPDGCVRVRGRTHRPRATRCSTPGRSGANTEDSEGDGDPDPDAPGAHVRAGRTITYRVVAVPVVKAPSEEVSASEKILRWIAARFL